MKQDKITIHGPKIDGTYIVEFKTADGVALAFSVPKGAGLPSWSTSKTRCPTGSRSRMSHGPFQEPFTGQKPFSKRPDPSRTGNRPGLIICRRVGDHQRGGFARGSNCIPICVTSNTKSPNRARFNARPLDRGARD